MTRPLSELDHAYLEAHEQSRRLHEAPRPLPTPDEIRAAHRQLARADLATLTAAVRDALKVAAPHWENQTRREAKFNRPGSACVCEVCDIVRALAAHLDLTD